jgi:hypothetical protein
MFCRLVVNLSPYNFASFLSMEGHFTNLLSAEPEATDTPTGQGAGSGYQASTGTQNFAGIPAILGLGVSSGAPRLAVR